MPQLNRRYIKRVWRVPKDRGALDYFAALLVKALVKHGWPVAWQRLPAPDYLGGGHLYEQGKPDQRLPADIDAAAQIACRVVARTYRVEATYDDGWFYLNHGYSVTAGGHFKKEK